MGGKPTPLLEPTCILRTYFGICFFVVVQGVSHRVFKWHSAGAQSRGVITWSLQRLQTCIDDAHKHLERQEQLGAQEVLEIEISEGYVFDDLL